MRSVSRCHTLFFLREDIIDGKCIRALLLWIPSKGLWTLYIISICLTMYMIWAKRMFRKDKILAGWHLSLPYPNQELYQWSFKAHLMWWWHVLPVKQALMNSYSRKLKWQTVDTALVFPKAMAQDGPVFTFTWIEKKKVYGFICVGKHSILYCAIHYYRKNMFL